jgi:hypothetical protein
MIKKFNDDLNTAVFTTKFVVEDKSPILYVFHYEEDGSWQFSGYEHEINDNDYRIVSLQEIINLDNSVLEIADLPLQYMAFRESLKELWKIKSIV